MLCVFKIEFWFYSFFFTKKKFYLYREMLWLKNILFIFVLQNLYASKYIFALTVLSWEKFVNINQQYIIARNK